MLESNRLLNALCEQDRAEFDGHFEILRLRPQDTLYNSGDTVSQAYFPCGGAMASFMVMMDDGRQVEAAVIGSEGAIGGIVSHGNVPAFSRSAVVVEGDFLRIPLDVLKDIKDRVPAVRSLFDRYADCLLAQIFQSAACNVSHLLEQRAAKWMIESVERTGTPAIEITQEQLASILGVGRSYASRVMQRFKSSGMLSTRRGGFTVLSIDKLRSESCNCNEIVRQHFDDVLAGVYPERMT